MGSLDNKVAIVTGAGRGIGREHSIARAGAGAKVVVNDLGGSAAGEGQDSAPAQQVADEIKELGGQATANFDNVADFQGAENLIKQAVGEFGRLDVLVNNAGISGTFDPDTLSTSAWDRLMEVNAKGVFLGMKHAIPVMEKAGGGAIVNISSVSGFVGQKGIHMAYNASKGAVRLMTKSAAVQYARSGIRVNSVHPGVLPAMRSSKATADPAFREKMLAGVPMRRAGRVEEVAHAVLFLASDEASYITGAQLPVDGGWLTR